MGSSCIVGRLALLYPVTLVCKEVINVLHKIHPDDSETRTKVSVADALRLAKALGMLYACSMFLNVLLVGMSYGLLCLAAGSALITCRGSDSLCKSLAAPIALVGVPISQMSLQIQNLIDRQNGVGIRGGRSGSRMGGGWSRNSVEHLDSF